MVGYEDYMKKSFSVQSNLKMQNRSALFTGSQASSACPSDRNSIKMKKRMKHLCKDTDRVKPNRFETNTPHCHTLTINPM
jgi:hypothetical protein